MSQRPKGGLKSGRKRGETTREALTLRKGAKEEVQGGDASIQQKQEGKDAEDRRGGLTTAVVIGSDKID